jgi:virginiamycin B lyase
MWFTEDAANKLGALNPVNGAISEYPITTPAATPHTIITGPDGNVWFTEYTVGKIAMSTTAGVITEFPLSSSTAAPNGIANGPPASLWITEEQTNTIAKVTP